MQPQQQQSGLVNPEDEIMNSYKNSLIKPAIQTIMNPTRFPSSEQTLMMQQQLGLMRKGGSDRQASIDAVIYPQLPEYMKPFYLLGHNGDPNGSAYMQQQTNGASDYGDMVSKLARYRTQLGQLQGGGVQGSYKKGGKVPRTGKYILHKGERVLNTRQTAKYDKALNKKRK